MGEKHVKKSPKFNGSFFIIRLFLLYCLNIKKKKKNRLNITRKRNVKNRIVFLNLRKEHFIHFGNGKKKLQLFNPTELSSLHQWITIPIFFKRHSRPHRRITNRCNNDSELLCFLYFILLTNINTMKTFKNF